MADTKHVNAGEETVRTDNVEHVLAEKHDLDHDADIDVTLPDESGP